MERAEFKKLFDNFNPVGKTGHFTSEDWAQAIQKWTPYYNKIVNGLSIDDWLKNSEGYLPDFLDTKEQKFGHARIGNYEQVMIYQYTGSDANRKNKYRDRYANPDASKVTDDRNALQMNYNNRICNLLREIATAQTLDEIIAIEQDQNYKDFACKQILRKITILISLMDNSPYSNYFMWFYNEGALENLAKLLDVDIEDSFLKTNYAIYQKAIKYAELNNPDKETLIKLYCFLLYMSDSSFNTAELSDFNSINIIFNGAPGTGKTYGVTQGIEKLQGFDKERFRKSKYIQFHPSYTYQDFIEGIKPVGIKDNNLDLKVVNGAFKEFCIFVKEKNEEYYRQLQKKPDINNPSDFSNWPHYFFIVDEINRGNLSNIFGETFTLLEKDYRDYDFCGNYTERRNNLISTALSEVIASVGENDLAYKKIDNEVLFGIPFNIHFIGIMNDVDKSIDTFDLALRRRFKWIPKYCDYDVIEDILIGDRYPEDQVTDYRNSCENLNNFICDTSLNDGLRLGKMYEIGHAFFLKIRNTSGSRRITQSKKTEVFNNYISGTLKEYIRLVADENMIDEWIKKAEKSFGI